MTEKWDIDEVIEFEVGETPCWQINLRRPDGNIVAHVMPQDILDIRAAEFGIDPGDVDQLMDIILHEEHVPRVEDAKTGPRFADGGPTLMTAKSTKEAREAHLARCKKASIRIDVKGHRALTEIRRDRRPDEKRIQTVKERVDTTRWQKQYGDLPVNRGVNLKQMGAAEKLSKSLGLRVSIPDLRQE